MKKKVYNNIKNANKIINKIAINKYLIINILVFLLKLKLYN